MALTLGLRQFVVSTSFCKSGQLKDKIMRESEWYKITICVNCKCRIKHQTRMYGGGICPNCGHDANSTICDTKNIIIKEIKHHKWWQFWKRKFTYVGKDEDAKRWLQSASAQNEY